MATNKRQKICAHIAACLAEGMPTRRIVSGTAEKFSVSMSTVQRRLAEVRGGPAKKHEPRNLPPQDTTGLALPYSSSEVLPKTEEEFSVWVRENVASPGARAIAIRELQKISLTGGIAALHAHKMLRELANEYSSYEGVPETITLVAYEEKKSDDNGDGDAVAEAVYTVTGEVSGDDSRPAGGEDTRDKAADVASGVKSAGREAVLSHA